MDQHLLPVQERATESKQKARFCPTIGLMAIMIATVAFIGLAVILISVGPAFKAKPGPVVTTSLGDIRGTSHMAGAVEAFYAIPFAEDPSGDKRFMPAKEFASPWEGVRDASTVGPRCWAPSTFPGAKNATRAPITAPAGVTFDEDCLHLNIYRQKGVTPQSQKAVMVWIHGGGMTVGSNVDQNLTAYAHEHDAIMVSINYRLGPLGFLLVNLDGNKGNGGMNGIHDQIVALKWIQNHIQAFGGDPNRVTVAGVSAGGLSVCTLSVSPLAKGLFLRAIVHSGSCTGSWGPGTEDYGLAVANRLMTELKKAGVSDLTTLHPSLLQWPHSDATDIEFPGYWVDGWVAPTHPRMLYNGKGQVNPKQMIIGGTSMDGVLPFVPYYQTPRIPTTDTDYLPALRDHWACGNKRYIHTLPRDPCASGIGDQAAKAYLLDDPVYAQSTHSAAAYVAADADFNINCPARYQAEALAKAGVDTYVYWFNHGPVNNHYPVGTEKQIFSTGGWAGHGSDVAFAWKLVPAKGWTKPEYALSRTISTAWHAFAVSGAPLVTVHPAGADNHTVSWPQFKAADHATMVLGAGEDGSNAVVRRGMKDDQCLFWRKVYSNASFWQPPLN